MAKEVTLIGGPFHRKKYEVGHDTKVVSLAECNPIYCVSKDEYHLTPVLANRHDYRRHTINRNRGIEVWLHQSLDIDEFIRNLILDYLR